MAKNIPFDKEVKREPSVYSGEKFEHCNWLKEVTVSPRVKTIKERAFYGCKSLEKVTIPEGVKKIDKLAFDGCINLKEVNLPESLEQIEFGAFDDCNSLKKLYIPQNAEVNYLGYLKNLECIELHPENIKLYLHQGILVRKKFNNVVCFPKRNTITKIVLPADMKFDSNDISDNITLQSLTIEGNGIMIGACLCENCENLEEVNLPDSITWIEREAFSNCKKLKSITLPPQLAYVEENAFSNCMSLESLFIPATTDLISSTAFSGCDSLVKIEVDPANSYFYKENGLLIAKNHSTEFRTGSYAHSVHCKTETNVVAVLTFEHNITDVVIPENVTTICSKAFSESNISSVTLANSVKEISSYAFMNCHNLASLSIGDGLEIIDYNSFIGCDNLKEITVSPNNQNFIVEDGMLLSKDKTKLYLVLPKEEIVVPKTVKKIAQGAFGTCQRENIKITLPEKYKCISDEFDGAKNCTIIISDVAKELSIHRCDNATIEVRHYGKSKDAVKKDYHFGTAQKVVLADSINNISTMSLSVVKDRLTARDLTDHVEDELLQEFVIPESVEIIERDAFAVASIPNLVVPDSVKIIETGALRGVKNVEVSNVCDIQDVYIDLDAPISFETTKGRIYTESETYVKGSTGNIVLHGVDSDESRQRYEMHKYWFGEVKPGLQKSGLDFFYWDASNNTFGARINDEIDAILNTTTMSKSDDVIGFVSTLANNINNANLGFKIVDEIVSEKEVIETKSKPKVKNGLFVMAVSDEEQKENAKKEREASMNDLFFKGVLYDYLEQNHDVKVSVCKVDDNGAKLGVDYHGCFLFTLTIPASVIDDGTSGDVIQNLLEEMDKYNVRCKLV